MLDDEAMIMGRTWGIIELDMGWANKKPVDMLCSTGCVATTRPFTDGMWEFGDFDAAISRRLLDTAYCVEESQTSS